MTLFFAIMFGLSQVRPQLNLPDPDNFVRAEGRHLVRNNEVFRFKSVSFSNFYYFDLHESGFDLKDSRHHIEQDFVRVRHLGFNSIRFALNGNWYRTDPDAFWRWLDKNVSWAAKHGVLLTLDLHVPIGGFWLDPSSDNMDFSIWTDEDTRRQNIELWRKITKRYRNSTAIGGFELLNEAVTDDATGDQWRDLAKELVGAIRDVNPNHLLIVGALSGRNRQYAEVTKDSLFLVDDPNVLYDFHFYEPMEFTHQSASWLANPIDDGGVYPENQTPIPTGAQVLLPNSGITSRSVPEGTTDWIKYDSGWVELRDPTAVAGLPILIKQSGARGKVDFADLEVFEFQAKAGKIQRILGAPLSGSGIRHWWEWGNVDQTLRPAVFTRSAAEGVNDTFNLSIEGNTSEDEYLGWSNDTLWFKATPGNRYKITGYMKGTDVSYPDPEISNGAFVGLALNFFADPSNRDDKGFYFRNAEFLEHQFLKRYQFGVDNNVPVSVMEFGTMGQTITSPGKGGASWLRDMLNIFEKYDTSFSFWNYRSASMGIYRSEFGETVEKPNVQLIDFLKEALAGPQDNAN